MHEIFIKFFLSFIVNFLLGIYSAFTVFYCFISRFFFGRSSNDFIDDSILVISPDSKIGDNVINLHFLFLLRLNFPKSYICLIHNENTQEIYASCPNVNELISISLDHSSIKQLINRYFICKKIMTNSLKGRVFSTAIIPRWDDDLYSPFLLWFSFSPKRIAFSNSVDSRKRIRNLFTDFLYSDISYYNGCIHEFEKPYYLLKIMLNKFEPIITSPQPLISNNLDLHFLNHILPKSISEKSKNIIAISIGAGNERRKWPLQNYANLINKINKTTDTIFLLFGSVSDFSDNEFLIEYCSDVNIINLAGKLSITELSFALSYSGLLICNDSGLLHIASIMGVPVLEFSTHPVGASPSHPNSPIRFGPYGTKSAVLRPNKPRSWICANGCCFSKSHCIADISVDCAYENFLLLSINLKNKLGAEN